MINVEVLRPQLLEALIPVEEAREEALRLSGRTDKDFLDEEGNLDTDKRKRGSNEAWVARQDFGTVADQTLFEIAEGDIIADDLDNIVLHKTLEESFSGWKKLPEYQQTPDSTESAVDFALDEANKFQVVLDWWKNPSELFAVFNGGKTSLYHAPLAGRIVTGGGFKRHAGNLNIAAQFTNGVTVHEGTAQHSADIASELKVVMWGWNGGKYLRVDDFKGDNQTAYVFIDPETIHDLGSRQKYSLRIAQHALAKEIDFEQVEIPAPSMEFQAHLRTMLTSSVIQEIAGRELETHPSRRVGSKYPRWDVHKAATLLSGKTKQDLDHILWAADISKSSLADELNSTAAKLLQSESFDAYFKGLRIVDKVKQFTRDFLLAGHPQTAITEDHRSH